MGTSRQVVTRQRVKQCDRYYTFSNDALDVMIPFINKEGKLSFSSPSERSEVKVVPGAWMFHNGTYSGCNSAGLSSCCSAPETEIEMVYCYKAPHWEINTLVVLLFQFQ